MTAVDFRAIAAAAAGKRWRRLDELERQILIRQAQRVWVERELGGLASKEDWPTWLAAQPPDVQDAALGAARARRYRAGELVVDRYTDPTERPLTLDELKATRPEHYNRAGAAPDDITEET